MLCVASAFAWGAKGHRIVAQVAYDNLDCKARKHVDKVLGKHGMIYLSSWADEIKSDTIYPQMADFTFYGGLHRPAKFIELPETHFDEGCWCASGLRVWSDVKENGDALLHLKSKIKNPDHADTIRYTVQNQNGAHIAELIETILRRKVSGVGLNLEETV